MEGDAGTRPDSRDELLCALKIAAEDEEVVDRRFEPGGALERFWSAAGAGRRKLERRIRDRYLALAAANDDHFVAPGRSDVRTGSGAGSATEAYRRLHQVASDPRQAIMALVAEGRPRPLDVVAQEHPRMAGTLDVVRVELVDQP